MDGWREVKTVKLTDRGHPGKESHGKPARAQDVDVKVPSGLEVGQ